MRFPVEIECAILEFLKRGELARVANASRSLRATVERHFGAFDRVAVMTMETCTFRFCNEPMIELGIYIERDKSRFMSDETPNTRGVTVISCYSENEEISYWRIDAALRSSLPSYVRVDKLVLKALDNGCKIYAWTLVLTRLPHAFCRLAALEMHLYARPTLDEYSSLVQAFGYFRAPTSVKILLPGAPRPLKSLASLREQDFLRTKEKEENNQ